MSVVEESRKLLQDLISPDLQALKAELKAVDERSALRDEGLRAELRAVDERLRAEMKGVEERSTLRDEALSAKIDYFDEKSRQRDEALSAKIDNIDEKSTLRDEALSAKIDFKFDFLVSKIDSLAVALNLDRRVEAIERQGVVSAGRGGGPGRARKLPG
jgi:transcription initiation factor TFIIIB Brf1 subunit/transcription initiation factor TFIIB